MEKVFLRNYCSYYVFELPVTHNTADVIYKKKVKELGDLLPIFVKNSV